jgi:predicted enzyme related to lactoylglutathione lyase
MSRVVHFEIQADDVERAKAFYAAAFGWTYVDYGQFTGTTYWGITTGPQEEPGINGGLLQRPAATPGEGQGTNAFVCTMGVGDYDETERRILEAGGRVALPKMALTGMAWQGYYLDTEGNTFGIHQPDPNAK